MARSIEITIVRYFFLKLKGEEPGVARGKKIEIFFKIHFLDCVNPRLPMNFSPFGLDVWPVRRNIYLNVLFYNIYI